MKNFHIFKGFGLLVLLLGFMLGCKKDYVEPEPEPLPAPTDIGIGIRLSIDSIECIYSDDERPGYDNSDIELYGYIRAWSSFLYPEAGQRKNFEKLDTSLLWFRDFDDYVIMSGGYGNGPAMIKIGKYTDFYFDNDKKHLTDIHIDYFFAEYDEGEATWAASHVRDQIMFTQEVDGKNEHTEPLVHNVEDIELYDRVFQRTYSLYVRDKIGELGKMVIKVHYSFHPVSVKSVATLPEGYSPGDEIIEPDLYPEIPTVSAYAAAPPAKSEELVVGQKALGKFSPEVLMVRWNNLPIHCYGLNPKFVAGSQLVSPVFEPEEISNNHSEEDMWNGMVWFHETQTPGKVPESITGPPLQSKPVIQMVRYWVPINIERIPAGVTLTTSTEVTHGVSAGFSYEYSITAGFETSGGVVSFNLEVSHTFGFTLNYNYSVSTTKTKEISAPDDRNVSFITWQLVEEFRVVDENGELFTDPNYDFKSMMIASIPTDHIVEEAHQFGTY